MKRRVKIRKEDLPGDKCNNCGVAKMNNTSNMGYLCGKCYLKKKKEDRLKKGLK